MSIKYIKPVYSKTQSGKSLDDRTDFARIYEDADDTNDINREDARRAIYETTADRINQELATVDGVISENKATFTFATPTGDSVKDELKKWGTNGEHYIDGYGVVYGKDERDVIAVQDKRTKNWFIAGEYTGKVTVKPSTDKNYVLEVESVNSEKYSVVSEIPETPSEGVEYIIPHAYARFDSEGDFMGDYLGEVEIRMSDYEF